MLHMSSELIILKNESEHVFHELLKVRRGCNFLWFGVLNMFLRLKIFFKLINNVFYNNHQGFCHSMKFNHYLNKFFVFSNLRNYFRIIYVLFTLCFTLFTLSSYEKVFLSLFRRS